MKSPVKLQSHKPKVLVVGGSFSGLATVRHLKQFAEVTLVEPKDYFEYTPGVLHLLAGSNAVNALVASIDEVAQGSKHIRGFFEGVKPSSRVAVVRSLDGVTQQQIDYDVLVICTGVSYMHPIRPSIDNLGKQSRYDEIRDFKEKVRNANKVVILGGGLVGVEMAAEIVHRCRFSNVPNVTLISRSKLLGTMPSNAGRYAYSWLRRRGVEILLEDTLSSISPAPAASIREAKLRRDNLRTSKGAMICDVDLIIDCSNNRMSPLWNSEGLINEQKVNCYRKSEDTANDADSVIWPYNDAGLVEVNEHLQTLWDDRIFAAGDVVELTFGVGSAVTTASSGPYGKKTNRPSVRNAHLAESQAELVATNIKKLVTPMNHTSNSSLWKYPSDVFYGAQHAPLLACVSLGPNNGIIIFNDLVLGGFFFGVLGGFVKYVIERSKMAEIKQKKWGRAFWALGHVVVNSIHSFWDKLKSVVEKRNRIFGKAILVTTMGILVAVTVRSMNMKWLIN